jgi:hypothetical protein
MASHTNEGNPTPAAPPEPTAASAHNGAIVLRLVGGQQAVREAIAQLLDYRRFLRPIECAVVLPVRPANDLADLIALCGFALVVPERGEFSTAHRSTLDPPAAIGMSCPT